MKRDVRWIFPEWDQGTCDDEYHRSWATISRYLMKEDQEPLVVGEYSFDQIKELAVAQKYHQKREEVRPDEILKCLAGLRNWLRSITI